MITNKDISIDSENGKITLNGNKYDLGTQGEIDTAVKDIYSVMGQMGAKNLIPYPYYRASGYSSNGMTITYDSDGVLTINKVAGSSTAYFSFINNDQDYCFKPNTEYKLLIELENANQLTIYLKYGDADIVLLNKKSTGKYVVNFTTPQTLQGKENFALNAAASDTETNAKVKVMIMLASDTDNTYEPYAMTNKQLTEQVADVKGTIGDITQTGVTGASVAAQIKELITMDRSVTGNIAITRAGAVRIITFNRVAYTDAQAFFTALAAGDKPTNVQFNTVMRTSNDNKYMTLGFVYVDSTGLTVKHFAGYNADGIEGQIGATDLVIGEIVYFV